MSWVVVIPFKGAPDAKSRLAGAFEDDVRARLALGFLFDTISAAREVPDVAAILVVSNEPGLDRALGSSECVAPHSSLAGVEVLPDPGDGLNAAIAYGIDEYRSGPHAAGHIAALLGDLPGLTVTELAEALAQAEAHPMSYVPDRAGTGTTMITLAPGVDAGPLFGPGSAAAHAAAGFTALDIPDESGLRNDVDSVEHLDHVTPGRYTKPLLRKN
ncbi:2-phospho-L-lactate guanylyltransferase [Gryllotalpicola sp.]|uniref:2-phospho-L-lactate guanylyltransferase n=1 Tax=Gryllotalpicola sp. TaxID=1932787 RepID=UPI00260513C5|nr:2-phospho-L-lactate guanylyltransferase [Gryllotalpicola sp.]